MSHVFETTPPEVQKPRRRSILPLVYSAGFAASYWSSFIWFYLRDRWQFDASENLFMNAGFGLIYGIGCLLAIRICRHLSARQMLVVGYAVLTFLTVLSGFAVLKWQIAAIILLHAGIVTWTWPNLEMLASRGLSWQDLGAALSHYNIGWGLSAAISFAVAGRLYQYSHLTLFIVPTAFFVIALLYVMAFVPSQDNTISPALEPEEEENGETHSPIANLLRTLSKMGNFGCYIVISTILPLMPFITNRLGLETDWATAFGAIWLIARVFAFYMLGRWHGWHYKLGIFMTAVVCLPVSFAIISLSSSLVLVGFALLVFGLSVGMIYTSALFYSLHGQAETGEAAFHEAIIGGGIMLGPLVGASAGRFAETANLNPTYAATGVVSFVMAWLLGLMIWKTAKKVG